MAHKDGSITQEQMDRLRVAAEGDSDDCFGRNVTVRKSDLADALYEIRMLRRLMRGKRDE